MLSVMTPPELAKADWGTLTAAERVALCHVFAREAAQLAQASDPVRRKLYRDIAANWNTLAAEMEQAALRDAPTKP